MPERVVQDPADDVRHDGGEPEGARLEERLPGRLEVRRQEGRDGQDDGHDDAGEPDATERAGRDDRDRVGEDGPAGQAAA